jgi:AAA domain
VPRPDSVPIRRRRVDGHAPPATRTQQVPGECASSVRTEATPARRRHQEHVEPVRVAIRHPGLDVADRLATLFNDERVNLGPSAAPGLAAALRSPQTRLIFVGDKDQLASVGSGSVLRDLIACGRIPLTTRRFAANPTD